MTTTPPPPASASPPVVAADTGVLVYPRSEAQVYVLDSGALIIDYGTHSAWDTLNPAIEARLPETVLAVGILQRFFLSHLRRTMTMEAFLAYWAQARERGSEIIWVLPGAAARNTETIQALKAAGHVVHASAADGACFAEFSAPGQETTVGMMGPAL